MASSHITPRLYAFLNSLAKNNDRTWFEANREQFECDVRTPLLSFISDFDVYLRRLSPHFVADARKVGGSLFRIHRDVRFSKDKSPYKTNVGVHFRHEQAQDARAPGYYLHLQPRNSFVGVGIWHPDTATAGRIRAAIQSEPEQWREAISDFGRFALDDENKLRRRPPQVGEDHPCLDDIMREDWIGVCSIGQSAACASDFMERFAAMCASATPFMRFLCRALDMRF